MAETTLRNTMSPPPVITNLDRAFVSAFCLRAPGRESSVGSPSEYLHMEKNRHRERGPGAENVKQTSAKRTKNASRFEKTFKQRVGNVNYFVTRGRKNVGKRLGKR